MLLSRLSFRRLSQNLFFIIALSCSFTIQAKTGDSDGYRLIEWTDLMPKDDLDALLSPPEYIQQIQDGSALDRLDNPSVLEQKNAEGKRYREALESTRIIAEFDGQKVRLPGFIVPLEMNEEHLVTEFFLVPYFGACLHLPPPPPNQIIWVSFPDGFPQEALENAFWLEGTLNTKVTESELGTAAYTMTLDQLSLYEE